MKDKEPNTGYVSLSDLGTKANRSFRCLLKVTQNQPETCKLKPEPTWLVLKAAEARSPMPAASKPPDHATEEVKGLRQSAWGASIHSLLPK